MPWRSKMGRAKSKWDDIFGYEEVKKKANILAIKEVDILIIGESGVGKRLFAEAIHSNSPRHDKPFVTIEIPSIPTHLFESELFGYRKGSFTDAKEDKVGLIESADSGSVFFDEIGDLAYDCQIKLLRVIEEKKLRRIGGNKEKTVDVRFIFATNRDLWKSASAGYFREDLLFRIGRHVLEIPPLRERESDFPEITRRIWKKIVDDSECFMFNKQPEKCCISSLNDEEIKVLLDYHFPGNIRQLESVLERTFIS